MNIITTTTHDVLVERPRVRLAVLLDDFVRYFLFAELFIGEVARRLGGLGGHCLANAPRRCVLPGLLAAKFALCCK